MNDDIQNIGIAAEISAEQVDEIQSGRPLVYGQSAANSEYAGDLSSFRRNLSRHSPLEGGNRLMTVAFLGQGNSLLRWNSGCGGLVCGMIAPDAEPGNS